MLQPPAGDQRAGLVQGRDHRLVRPTLLALVGDDRFAGKAGGIGGERTVRTDGEGNRRLDTPGLEPGFGAGPGLEIVPTVARRGVDEAGAGIVGDMVAGE